jgi:hypothetical protein
VITPEELKARLGRVGYPCYLVIHGAARHHRTTYRGEHHGVFSSGTVGNAEEALRLIDGADYPGHYSEMDLIAVSVEDGQLVETVIV